MQNDTDKANFRFTADKKILTYTLLLLTNHSHILVDVNKQIITFFLNLRQIHII